jgi:hypothetical protein
MLKFIETNNVLYCWKHVVEHGTASTFFLTISQILTYINRWIAPRTKILHAKEEEKEEKEEVRSPKLHPKHDMEHMHQSTTQKFKKFKIWKRPRRKISNFN